MKKITFNQLQKLINEDRYDNEVDALNKKIQDIRKQQQKSHIDNLNGKIKNLRNVKELNRGYFTDTDKWHLEKLIIPNNITSIGENALRFTDTLHYLSIPGSVKKIGDYAFYDCGLWKLSLSEGIVEIGDSAFRKCDHLSGEVKIPNSVKKIGKNAFSGCESLNKISIGNGIKIIEDETFFSCLELESVIIPNSVVSIGDEAFQWCGFKSIEIPNSVTTIGFKAFDSEGLKSIYFIGKTIDEIKQMEYYPWGIRNPEKAIHVKS